MKYSRFEDLPVWKEGARLFVRVDALCEDREVARRGDVADQIHRAALSITNNIAEGFEQGTTQQLITHLYYAKGSAGEVRSILQELVAIPRFAHLKPELVELRSKSEAVSRQLSAFAESLQNSELEGHRYLTDEARELAAKRSSREAFERQIAEVVARARNEREQERLNRDSSSSPSPVPTLDADGTNGHTAA
jgi:four helix bundle protein